MKQLIIGIDGGTREVFEKMPMPFTQSLMKEARLPKLEIDLLSRGWAEQISGKYARDTKAFYRFPILDGTRQTLLKYSLDQLISHQGVVPIWEIAKKQNASVGIMNIPTTFPAPSVNGFFVSGAGGGLNKVEGVPDEMCYPREVSKDLERQNYVVDIRPGTAGITQVKELFDKLDHMLRTRVTAFLKLCKEHQPELGFLALRVVTVLQYLAMSEIQVHLGTSELRKRHKDLAWSTGLEKTYKLLDQSLEKIFNATNPDHWMLTADHSIVPYTHRCDCNRILQDLGLQKYKLDPTGTIKNLIKQLLNRQAFCIARQSLLEDSIAFADWYISAIFVNDHQRFGGPVKDADLDNAVDQICDKFNKHPTCIHYKMKAVPYRRHYKESRYFDFLPDIKVDCSESIFFKNGGPCVSKNPDFTRLKDLKRVRGSMHSGQKGRHPLFCCDSQTAKLIQDNDPHDLTLVYKLTERIFGDKT